MNPDRVKPKGNPIPLNPYLLRSRGSKAAERDIRQIVRSVRFELLEQECAIRLVGPDMSYHNADPYLQETLKTFGESMVLGDILSYKLREDLFDLCFEDSWTGYFISDHLDRLHPQEDLVLIHVDDHTDMMPTLLTRCGTTLIDPTTNRIFDPARNEDWEAAIYSGCISIGNFMTPLFYSGHKVHVRHLNNGANDNYLIRNVTRDDCRYEFIPDKKFAALCKSDSLWENSAGTYLAGSSPKKILHAIPRGRVIVHIDLDYFINDFNGNSGGQHQIPCHNSIHAARRKINRFFEALHMPAPSVDRWIVATSPGFCSAYHWDWLLAAIRKGIENFRKAQ